MKVRSPLIWFGGKSKVAHHIINRMPNHKCYVEPFGGAAHVLAQKDPVDCEVYNDIDGDVVNFMLTVRADKERFIKTVESLPYSRQLYQEWRDGDWPIESFERAVRFFYLNRSGIAKGNGDAGGGTGWRHSSKTNTARAYHTAVELIDTFTTRMKNVLIDHRDFREIFRVYDGPDTLFYVDPPYIGKEKYYALTEADKQDPLSLHKDLAEILNNIEGKAILSYYDNPLLLELYPDWRREKFDSFKQVVNGDNRYAEELLMMNFDDGQLTIFDLNQEVTL